MKLLTQWLGSGGQPVPPWKASARADICRQCPKNNRGHWLRFVTGTAAVYIRQTLALKHQMNLELPDEDKVGTCDVCACQLKLKCWVPIERIRETTDSTDFPPHCWIPKEIGSTL